MRIATLTICLVILIAANTTAREIWDFPNATGLRDDARIFLYEPGGGGGKNITGLLLKQLLAIPGPQGPAGPQGIQGPPGATAADGVSYSNPTYTTVAAALDQLLYVAPSSPSVSGGGSYEQGQTISTVNLSWSITLGTKPLISQSIDNGIGALNVADRSYNHTGQSITANRTYTVSISDGTTPRSGSTTLAFYWRRHWGASSIPLASFTSANILSLASNEFASSHTKSITYNCTGGLYPVFAYPASWGTLASVKVGGLAFSDYSYRTISHTNASGGITNYYVYQFNNLQTGSSIAVDWD